MRSVTLNFADWLEAIFWHSFWHIFWHSFWQIFWYIFWHSFWHTVSVDIVSDISSDILSGIFLTFLLTFFLTYLLTFFLTYLLTCFLTYLLTFFLTYQNQNLTSTASQKKPLCKLYIYLTPRSKSNIHDNFVPVNVIALSASDRPAKRQLSPKMQNACSSTHTHTPHASDRPAKRQLSPKMQKGLRCHNYISWRVQTMKPDACHCGSFTSSV